MTPLRQTKLSDQVYEQVLGLIASAEFQQQSKLPTETELSETFGVSRTVVREAIARLRDDGVVVSRQGAGTFVLRRPPPAMLSFAPTGSIADIQRCFEFRESLEGETAWYAAHRMESSAVERIRQVIEALDEVVRIGSLGVELDYDFHFAIAEASANRFFISVMSSLRMHIEFGLNLTRNLSLMCPVERPMEVQAEHWAIYDAIKNGQPAAAREAMRLHIGNARTRMFEGQIADRLKTSGRSVFEPARRDSDRPDSNVVRPPG